jgi:hypothetical protein
MTNGVIDIAQRPKDDCHIFILCVMKYEPDIANIFHLILHIAIRDVMLHISIIIRDIE